MRAPAPLITEAHDRVRDLYGSAIGRSRYEVVTPALVIPLAFGMGPAIRELQPGLAQWYFEHATPTTEFIADVSGAGYMQPDHFAEAYVDREKVWTGFLQWTHRLMESLNARAGERAATSPRR